MHTVVPHSYTTLMPRPHRHGQASSSQKSKGCRAQRESLQTCSAHQPGRCISRRSTALEIGLSEYMLKNLSARCFRLTMLHLSPHPAADAEDRAPLNCRSLAYASKALQTHGYVLLRERGARWLT